MNLLRKWIHEKNIVCATATRLSSQISDRRPISEKREQKK